MIELRWAVPEGTTTERPRLQFRMLGGGGLGQWSNKWMDVPTVVVPQEPPKPADGVKGLDHG